MKRIALLISLVACGGPKNSDSATEIPDTWSSLLAEHVDGGMFLSGWENPEGTLVMVGGNLTANSGRLGFWDGSTLCVEDDVTDAALWWLDGQGSDWYAVGTSGAVIHDNGSERVRLDVPTNATLFGVYVDGEDVWVAGGDTSTVRGEIWRMKTGQDWELVMGDLPGLVFKTWNGWFVGDGVAYYWNGTALEERHPPNGERLLTMHGPSADDAYAVGGLTAPVVLRWQQGAWSEVASDETCLHAQLSGVWVDDDGTVWVAGHNGTASSYDGSTWSCDTPPITAEHFHGVVGHKDQVLWMGGNLLSTADNYGTIGVHPAAAPLPQVSACK
ncbi:MAG: hypothetical protein GWP91_15175 [Rhodobacterales bacterium]|nr:hypothetical protein [Rhodobacterales bacterium]